MSRLDKNGFPIFRDSDMIFDRGWQPTKPKFKVKCPRILKVARWTAFKLGIKSSTIKAGTMSILFHNHDTALVFAKANHGVIYHQNVKMEDYRNG